MSTRNARRHRTASVEQLEIAVFVGEYVSLATVKVNGVVGLGEAKRIPGDVWSDKTGRDLSVGRALRDASDQLLEKYQVSSDLTESRTEGPSGDSVAASGGDVE